MRMKSFLRIIFSRLYSIAHLSFPYIGKGNVCSCKGVFLNHCHFGCNGFGNKIEIGPGTRLSKCKFHISGNYCKIHIDGGKETHIKNAEFWCEDNYSEIIIGEKFWMEGGHLAAIEGCSINIGDKCLFSSDIEVRTGDSHSILSLDTEKRINISKDVNIGNHVWIGAHSRLLKGTSIPNDCVVANSSVVTSMFGFEHIVIGGIPAKELKERITWDSRRF